MPEDTILQLFFLQTVLKVLLLCCPEARHLYPQWNRCGSPEIDPFYYRANRFSTVVPCQGGGSSPVTWHIEWEGHLYTRIKVNSYLILHSHTNFYFQYFMQTSSKKTQVIFMSWAIVSYIFHKTDSTNNFKLHDQVLS